jgi:hypothetical protein
MMLTVGTMIPCTLQAAISDFSRVGIPGYFQRWISFSTLTFFSSDETAYTTED